MKDILIIKTGRTVGSVPPQRGDFEHWIMAGMALPHSRFQTVEVCAEETLPVADNIAGMIITGSPAMVTDGLPWSERTATYLRDAIEKDMPVLGICYGHQLLAHALGGRVDFHLDGREMGTTEIRLAPEALNDPLFAGIPACFPVHVSHSQSVVKLPENSLVLAANAFEAHHAVRFRERVWGLQFHPEFDADIMRAYIHERRQALMAEGMDVPQLLADVEDTPGASQVLRNFSRLIAD
ncbi:MAG: glutamine amidotransferase [Pseudomonadales bacterium]|nr:glutamine amidotransferase [Pseudomonadales bacterium]